MFLLFTCRYREEDDLDWERPDDAYDDRDRRPVRVIEETVEEDPVKVTSYKPEESAPVGKLLQALAGDEDHDRPYSGDVNENVPKQVFVQSSDEALASGSDDYAPEADDNVNDHHGDKKEGAKTTMTNGAKSILKPDDIKHNIDLVWGKDQSPDPINEFSVDFDSEDSQEFDTIGITKPEDMERVYSSPEPEVPFTQSKIKSVESSNIGGLLESLKAIPKPKPTKKSSSPQKDSKGRRKVTDDEVVDALQYLLGGGARVPRTRSAMDLRDERAKKLRGEDKASSRAFILVMMPDGTKRRVSVDRHRRGSLGNELDSSDEHLDQSLNEALRNLSPSNRRKLPKNEFDGREERPPTPRTSSSSSLDDDDAKFINPEPSDIYSDQDDTNSRPDGYPEEAFPEPVSDQTNQNSDLDNSLGNAVVPSPHRPNEDIFDFSKLDKLRPEGEFDSYEEPVSKPKVVVPDNVTVDDLVANLPNFDREDSDNDDSELERTQPPAFVEADIQASAAVIPEESSVDLVILEKKPESVPSIDTRSPSLSDASTTSMLRPYSDSNASSTSTLRPYSDSNASSTSTLRPYSDSNASSTSTLRPHSSSDTSSKSDDSQEVPVDSDEPEDEIVPVSKQTTETSPDLSSLEKLRPAGMEAPLSESNQVTSVNQPEHVPTERGDVSVQDLEHMLPRFDSSSESEDDTHEPNQQATPVDEEPLNPITINPEENPIDMSGLDPDLEHNDLHDSRPYDVSDILDDLTSGEDDWPAPPETSSEHDWPATPGTSTEQERPAPPDNMHDPGFQQGIEEHEDDEDMPPPPRLAYSPDTRIASFMSPEPPKSPKPLSDLEHPPAIVVTASSDDLNAEFETLPLSESDDDQFDDDQGEPEFDRIDNSGKDYDDPNFSVEPQESSVDPKSFSRQESDSSSSSEGGTSVDAVPFKEGAIVSITCKPTETTPDLRSLEKFRPDGTDEVPLSMSPPKSDDLPKSNKEPAKISDLEDLIPKFDSASESDDDHQQPPHSPIFEADITVSETPRPEESPVDLAEFDRNIKDKTIPPTKSYLNDTTKPRTESEISTESQEFVMDIPDTDGSDVDDVVVPVSYAPVESTPDLAELERKLRPPDTKSPVSSDTEYQPDNQPVKRTGATVEDLKDLIPGFDMTSESSRSSQSDSSEPTTPVDEMIEEIGTVSPTRTYFDFDGLERHVPEDKTKHAQEAKTEPDEAHLDDFADRKSQDIIIESYMSLFREERVMELLKTVEVDEEASSENKRREPENKPSPEVGIKERASFSSSAEGGSSSESEVEHEISGGTFPAVNTHIPDSPSKKRRSIGLDHDGVVDDDETPAKKPKSSDETQEPIIIEASISVFREETIIESFPDEKSKPDFLKAEDDGEDEWPAPPSPIWPAPPPPEVIAEENWPAPPEELTAPEPRTSESGKEDLDAEDTSSVSTSSTEGEYVPEPSPSGADRVFVLTVIPTMDTFKEEEEEEEEAIGRSGDVPERSDMKEEPSGVFISTDDTPAKQEAESSSSSSESESESSAVDDKKPQEDGQSDEDEKSQRLDSFSGDDQDKNSKVDVPSQIEKSEPSISVSAVEPVESAPRERAEVQPGFEPEIDNSGDIPREEDNMEPESGEPEGAPQPERVGKDRMFFLSDPSSADDASILHHQHEQYEDEKSDSVDDSVSPRAFTDTPYDDQMEQENDEEGEDYRRRPAPTHDSEGESDNSYSTESESGNESPFSPVGARIFILTGLPSHSEPSRDDAPLDADNDNFDKNLQDTDIPTDYDNNSNTILPEKTEPIPDLIPVETPPTATDETPDFIDEKSVEVEPIENLESTPMAVTPSSESAPMATTPSSESEEDTQSTHADIVVAADVHAPDIPSSPDVDISPQMASDTFSSPTSDDALPQKQSEHLPDFSSDVDVSDENVAPEQPIESFNEEEPITGSDHEQNGINQDLGAYEPEHCAFVDTQYNEPQTFSEIPSSYSPKANDWSAPSGHSSPPRSTTPNDQSSSSKQLPEQSGRVPSFSHYIPTGKPNEPQVHSEIPPTYSPQNANDWLNQPSVHPAIPNLAPNYKFTTDDNHPYRPDDVHFGSDAEVAEFTSIIPKETDFSDPSESKETDISDPAVSNLAPYMPPSRSPIVADSAPYSYSMPDPHMSKSTDIVDPASPDDIHHYDMPPSKETDINDPGIDVNDPSIVPLNQGSKSTDLTDPAVPEFVSESPGNRSPFQPLQMHASPARYGKQRSVTPVELETSLVPPDVYTSDDAYDQFQIQYRGHIDDDDFVVPEMRQKHPEPAVSKRKRPEEKIRRKDHHAAVSDIPSYMAPPPPISSEVAKAKGRRVPPPTPPRIESDPLLRKSTHPGPQPHADQPKRHRHNEPDRRHERPRSREYHEYDEPPISFQTTSKSTDINDPGIPHNRRPKSMDISDLPVSYPSRSKSTDIIDPVNSYPTRSMSTNYLPSEPNPVPIQNRPPTHTRSMDIHASYHAQPGSRSTDLTDPAVAYQPRSKSTDINDPGLYYPERPSEPVFEALIARPSKAAPQYLVPSRGPIPDITKPQPAMHKDVELESLKRQLHKLGSKMAMTRQELDKMKRNNPANRYASPVDRVAQSRGSSRSSIDSPDADMPDLKFSRKFFSSLTDKEFGKMLEEMRLYRMAVRQKGADLKRLSKQCDGIRLRLRQLGEPLENLPAADNGSKHVGAIETTI